ncbi:MAG: hypothetical protein QXR48_02145 [Candidatus Woesearchaeota archaeon]
MSEDKQVWVVDSEEMENRIRAELSQIPKARIVCFRNVCHAIDTLRKGHKPKLILCNHHAADLILEIAYQQSKYAGINTAYISAQNLSLLAESHGAGYIRMDEKGNFNGLSDYVRKQLE